MILRRDEAALGPLVDGRLVVAAVAKLQLVCLRSNRKSQQLVAQTDAEERLVIGVAQVLGDVLDGLRACLLSVYHTKAKAHRISSVHAHSVRQTKNTSTGLVCVCLPLGCRDRC